MICSRCGMSFDEEEYCPDCGNWAGMGQDQDFDISWSQSRKSGLPWYFVIDERIHRLPRFRETWAARRFCEWADKRMFHDEG